MLGLIKRIYTQKQHTLFNSTVIVAMTLIIARILGLIKLRVLTGFYSQQELDLFLAAFRIPDFIFEVFVAGSIASCFIPIVNDILDDNTDNKEQAMLFAQSLSFIFLCFWLVFIVIMSFYAKSITGWLVPGFNSAQINKIASMSNTILFFQVPFLLMGNVIAALLQSSRQFLVPGLAPIFYNLGIILGVVLWAKSFGLNGAILGIIFGSAFYFLILFIGLFYLKFPLQRKICLFSPRLKRFFRLFWPRFFTSATVQIDATVDLALSTLRGLGSYTSFYLARNLQILPVSLLGIAISQSALPFFSTLYHQGKQKELMNLFIKLVLQIVFVMLPFVIFFISLRILLVRLFFGGQMFDWEATVNTAKVLSVFALSLPFHTVYYLITRVYYAIEDTRTPFITSLIFTALNTVLSIIFIKVYQLPIWFLALSFTISIAINSTVLLLILLKRLDHYHLTSLIYQFAMMFFISLTTFSIVWTSKRLLDELVFDTTRTLNLFLLTLTLVVIGLAVYLYLAWVFLPKILFEALNLFTRVSFIQKSLNRYRKFLYTHKIIVTAQDNYDDRVIK